MDSSVHSQEKTEKTSQTAQEKPKSAIAPG